MKAKYGLLSVVILIVGNLSFSGHEPIHTSTYGQTQSDLLIAFTTNRTGDDEIYVMNSDGSGQSNLTRNPTSEDYYPVWSPDGSKIAFTTNRNGGLDIYLMDFTGAKQRNLTPPFPNDAFAASNDREATWSPDGRHIVFVSDRTGADELYLLEVPSEDSSLSKPIQLTSDGNPKGEPAISTDGSKIAFWANRNSLLQIHTCDFNGNQCANLRPLTNNGNNTWPRWSPTGQIAYESEREDNFEVRIMDALGSGQRSYGGDAAAADGRPSWSPDGQFIVFNSNRTGNDELYIMTVAGEQVMQLTDEPYADHSPSWQPKVPTVGNGQLETPESPSSDPGVISSAGNIGHTAEVLLTSVLQQYSIREWHDEGWLGNGQAIGVLDYGFRGILELEDFYRSDDFDIIVPKEHSKDDYSNAQTDTAHGTHVIEVLHEVAPNARIFACRYQILEDFRFCVDYMISQRVNIINHSAGVPALPLNGENEWSRIAREAFQNNILWVNAAGDFRDGSLIDFWRDNPVVDANGNIVTPANDYYEQAQGLSEKIVFDTLPADVGGLYDYPIILSWTGTNGGNAENLDFDLEFYDLATDEPLAIVGLSHAGSEPQAFERWPSPNIPLQQLTRPFYIKIKNVSRGIVPGLDVQISLFVSFAKVPGNTIQMQTVIAPADSTSVLTVGALQNGVSAPYSSYDVYNANYHKPDLLAPGEFILHDGTSFIGTSAASPIIAGMAALYREYRSDDSTSALFENLREEITNNDTGSTNQNEYGFGILALGYVPVRDETHSVDPQAILNPNIPSSIYPLPNGTVNQATSVCNNGRIQRLVIGSRGYMLRIPGPDVINVRSGPGSQATAITELTRGDEFTVIGGPECSVDGVSRWEIQLADGSSGWIAEGTDYYFVTPISLTEATLPPTLDTVCPNAPPAKFAIGDTAIVAATTQLRLTSQPRGDGNSSDNIDVVLEGTRLRILGGPSCSTAGDEWRWYVRDLGTSFEGWVSEGEPGEVWMCPEANPDCEGPIATELINTKTPTSTYTATPSPSILPSYTPTRIYTPTTKFINGNIIRSQTLTAEATIALGVTHHYVESLTQTAIFLTSTPSPSNTFTASPTVSPSSTLTATSSLTPTASPSETSAPMLSAVAAFDVVDNLGGRIGNGTIRVFAPSEVTYPETILVQLELEFDSVYITPTPFGPVTAVPVETFIPQTSDSSFAPITPRPTVTPRIPIVTASNQEIFRLMGATLRCDKESFTGCDDSETDSETRVIDLIRSQSWNWILRPTTTASGNQIFRISLWTPSNGTQEIWSYVFSIEVIPQDTQSLLTANSAELSKTSTSSNKPSPRPILSIPLLGGFVILIAGSIAAGLRVYSVYRKRNALRFFINYRREDSEAWAGRIYDHLKKESSQDLIFRDVDSLSYGTNFIEAIKDAIRASDVIIVVIGKNWINLLNERMLKSETDFVRLEIAVALELGKKVVPAFVDTTAPLKNDDLPDDLKRLALMNGIYFRNDSFDGDIKRLIKKSR